MDEVAIIVSKFVVIGIFEFIPSEIGIGESVNVARKVITEGIEAVFFEDFDWVDDVTN